MYLHTHSFLKWAYVIAVLSIVLPIGAANSGWVVLASGRMPFGAPVVGPIVLLIIGLYRVFHVLKSPGTLDAPMVVGFANVLRKVGILLLTFGAIVGALNLISMPLLLALPSRYTREAPIFFVAGMYFYMLSGFGSIGVTLFEFSRILGFEQQARAQRS